MGRFSRALNSFVDADPNQGGGDGRGTDFDRFCQSKGWQQVGLGADWSVDAYQISPANQDPGYGVIAFDVEDEGQFMVAFARSNTQSMGLPVAGEEDYYENPACFVQFYKGDLPGMIEYTEQNLAKLLKYLPKPVEGS